MFFFISCSANPRSSIQEGRQQLSLSLSLLRANLRHTRGGSPYSYSILRTDYSIRSAYTTISTTSSSSVHDQLCILILARIESNSGGFSLLPVLSPYSYSQYGVLYYIKKEIKSHRRQPRGRSLNPFIHFVHSFLPAMFIYLPCFVDVVCWLQTYKYSIWR